MGNSSYLLSEIVLHEADNKFAQKMQRSIKKTEIFKKTCEKLDAAITGDNIREMNISVDECTGEIHVELVMDGVWDSKSII